MAIVVLFVIAWNQKLMVSLKVTCKISAREKSLAGVNVLPVQNPVKSFSCKLRSFVSSCKA